MYSIPGVDTLYTQENTPANSTHGKLKFKASGNFIVPDNVWTVWVTLMGGGGGGGYGDTVSLVGSCGGYGGLYIAEPVKVVPGMTIPVTIGPGGGGAPNSANASGSAGSSSTFGSFLTATGGAGGGGSTGGAAASGAPPSFLGMTGGFVAFQSGMNTLGSLNSGMGGGSTSTSGGGNPGDNGYCVVEW